MGLVQKKLKVERDTLGLYREVEMQSSREIKGMSEKLILVTFPCTSVSLCEALIDR